MSIRAFVTATPRPLHSRWLRCAALCLLPAFGIAHAGNPAPAEGQRLYTSGHLESPQYGRRDQPALIVGEVSAHDQAYLVLLRLDESGAATTKRDGGDADQRLQQVQDELLGLGAVVHTTLADDTQALIVSMDRRAVLWTAWHPAVDAIEALNDAQLQSMVEAPQFGGRERAASNLAQKGWTDTRILVNGGIVGWQVSGYRQPSISSAGNLLGHAAEVLRRLNYNISWNATTQTLHAHRNTSRSFAGAIEIRLTHNSRNMVLREADSHGYIGTRTVQLPENARVDNGVMLAPIRAVMQHAGIAIFDWDQDTRSLQTYYYEELDVGIYFLGVQQNAVRNEQPGAQKFIPGQPNPFFNSSRPTIIYAHGWNKDSVLNRNREGLLFVQDNQWQNVQNFWLTRGWNVGIFQWLQLADDDWGLKPVDTEKKIYDANSANIGMRWKRSNGVFSSTDRPTLNVTQLYRQSYLQVAGALAAGVEIRLIGNSLGGNLTLNMVRELVINGSRTPSRVTLHDPYWDSDLRGLNFPGAFVNTRAVAVDAAQRVSNRGIALEYFRSSVAGQQGYVRGVAQIGSYVNFVPGYTSNQAIKHTQATRQYLWGWDFGGTIASPRTAHSTVRARMNTNNYWDHVGGTATATPGDDSFLTRSGKP